MESTTRIVVALLLLPWAGPALAGTEGYTPARELAATLKLECMVMSPEVGKPPMAAILTGSRHKTVLYADMMHATVDGEVWSLPEPILASKDDILVPEAFRVRLARHMNVALPAPSGSGEGDKPPLARAPLRGRVVVVDPGHGGRDPGAVGTRCREKDIVLDVGKRVTTLLRSVGVRVVMTRRTDVFVTLNGRVRIANRHLPDLFVSIHADASPNRNAEGTTLFYPDDRMGGGKSDITYRARLHGRGATLSPDVIGAPGRLSEAVEVTVFGALLEEYRARSWRASRRILWSLCRKAGTESRGVRQANFRVVRYMRCPTVLVELDFLSNPAAERRMGTTSHRQRMAEGIAEGIGSYLRSTPARSGGKDR